MGLENIVPGMPVERILREFQEAIKDLEDGGGGNVYDGIKTIKIFEPSVLWQGVGGTGETADYTLPLSRDLDVNFKGFVRESTYEFNITTEGTIPARITTSRCLGIASMDILFELLEEFEGQENPDIVTIFEASNGELTYFAFEFEVYAETKPDEFNWVPVIVSYDFDFKFNFIIEGSGTNNIIMEYNYDSGLIGETGILSHRLVLGEKEGNVIIPRYTRMNINEAGTITYLPLQFPFMDSNAIVNEIQASLGNLYMDENGFIKLKRP